MIVLYTQEKSLYSNENMSENITFIDGCDEILYGEKYHTFYFYDKNSKSSHITFEARFKECVKTFDESAKFINENNFVFKKIILPAIKMFITLV